LKTYKCCRKTRTRSQEPTGRGEGKGKKGRAKHVTGRERESLKGAKPRFGRKEGGGGGLQKGGGGHESAGDLRPNS